MLTIAIVKSALRILRLLWNICVIKIASQYRHFYSGFHLDEIQNYNPDFSRDVEKSDRQIGLILDFRR